MRLAIIGAQNTGKSTVIQSILAQWPMYSLPDEKTDYRNLIKEKNLSLNEMGNMESQMVIREALLDMALSNAGKKYSIHDRCMIDNLVYSLWLAEHHKLDDDSNVVASFLSQSMLLARESMRFYDILFWTPINPEIPISQSENRSQNAVFREEIDNMFAAVYENYKANTGLLFPVDDQPTMIRLEGDLSQRMATIGSYIGADGDIISVEGSAILDMQTAYEEECLRRQVR